MTIFILAHIDTWADGIPCYGSIELFTDRQKAMDRLTKEYDGTLVSDKEVEEARSSCMFGPIGWVIWEDDIN